MTNILDSDWYTEMSHQVTSFVSIRCSSFSNTKECRNSAYSGDMVDIDMIMFKTTTDGDSIITSTSMNFEDSRIGTFANKVY